MNNYEILGIAYGSDTVIIKKAYRKLVIQYHPDKTGGDQKLTEKFLKIQKAYDELLSGNTGDQPVRPPSSWQQRSSTSYRQSAPRRKINENFSVYNKFLNAKGEFELNIMFEGVERVELIGKYGGVDSYWRPKYLSRHDATICVSVKDLKRFNYKITLRFKGISGNYVDKKYKLKEPLNFFQRIGRWIKKNF